MSQAVGHFCGATLQLCGGLPDFCGAAAALSGAAAALSGAAAELSGAAAAWNSLENSAQARPPSIRVMSALRLSSHLVPRTSYLGKSGAGGEGRAGTFPLSCKALHDKQKDAKSPTFARFACCFQEIVVPLQHHSIRTRQALWRMYIRT